MIEHKNEPHTNIVTTDITWQSKDEFSCSLNVSCGKGSRKTDKHKHTGNLPSVVQ